MPSYTMSNTANTDGHAVVSYQIVSPNGDPILLAAGSVTHDTVSTVETVYGMCGGTHRLRCSSVDFVDARLNDAMASGTPRIRFRIGVADANGTQWLPWQDHIVTNYSAKLEGHGDAAGHAVEMESQDLQFLLSRNTHVASRKGRISEIVRSIVADRGFTDSVVEGTVGEAMYVQSYQDDASFIRKRLIRRARNEKGRGNFLFFFKDNAVHFHSPDYQASLHNMVYFKANGASLVQNDSSQRMMDNGVAGTQVVSYDPYTGQTKVYSSDPEKALKLADSIYDYSRTSGVIPILYHSSGNSQEEAQVIGQNTYEHVRSEAFSLTLELERTVHIRHGDYINLVISPTDNRTSPWSGYYLVSEVRHVVKSGHVRSRYRLTRGEMAKKRSNLTSTAKSDMLVVERDAPGSELNLAEIKSSQHTKGAGKFATAGKLYSTVLTPNG